MTQTDLYTFMAQSKLGVLGSVYDDSPQAALVGIAVTRELEIVFDTVMSSRKYRNLAKNAKCSFVIGWAGEQTLQYEGEARELKSPELQDVQEIYFQAWPECRSHLTWAGIVYIAVRPKWIRFSDYDRNPPLIEEFSFESV